jgi:hypothetical protein
MILNSLAMHVKGQIMTSFGRMFGTVPPKAVSKSYFGNKFMHEATLEAGNGLHSRRTTLQSIHKKYAKHILKIRQIFFKNSIRSTRKATSQEKL